jgi:hypothetical protein
MELTSTSLCAYMLWCLSQAYIHSDTWFVCLFSITSSLWATVIIEASYRCYHGSFLTIDQDPNQGHVRSHWEVAGRTTKQLDGPGNGEFKVTVKEKLHWEPLFLSAFMWLYEGVSKSFRTGRLERELQMVQLSATRCSSIAILWVSLVSFRAETLCVASQRVFIVVYIVIDSVRELLDTPSYILTCLKKSSFQRLLAL